MPSQTKLDTLIEAATELDRRIEKIAVSPLSTLKPEEVRQVLIEFGKQLLREGDSTAIYDDSRYNPLLIVNQAIADGSEFSEEASLSLRTISQLKLIEFSFAHMEKEQELQASVYTILQLMQFAFARVLLNEPHALLDPNHPSRTFFELALRICKECDEASYPRTLDLYKTMRTTILTAIAASESPTESMTEASETFNAYIHDYSERLAKLDERLIAKEHNQRKLFDVRQSVREVISHATDDKHLPTFAITFLYEVWSKYLYLTYLRLGVESPQWREGLSDMYQLIWSLVTHDGEELNRRMAGRLSESLRRIKKNTGTVHHPAETDRFFNTLAEVQARIIDGKELDPALFEGAEEVKRHASEEAEEEPTIEPTVEVKAAEKGDWFKIDHRGRASRLKLIDKNLEERYLLFSDHSGVLGGKFSFDEFTTQFRRGTIRPLDMKPAFEGALEQGLRKLERYIGVVTEQISNRERDIAARRAKEAKLAKQQKLKQEKQLKREQEEAERKREEEERKERIRQELELKRQLEEETRRQEEEARLEAERKNEEARLAREAAFNAVMAEVEKLEPGGMLELVDEQQEPRICSLSMKLKRTGKLLFVDQTGRRIAEHLPEELAQRITDGSARIIEYAATGNKRLDDLRWARLQEELAR